MSWTGRITTELRSLKDHGLDFPQAWAVAIERHPAPASAYGPAVPTFEDAQEEPLIAFMERIAREAWDGGGTRLDRGLLEDAVAGVTVHARQHTAAAWTRTRAA